MKVVIIGACGFLGSQLARQLRHHDLVLVDSQARRSAVPLPTGHRFIDLSYPYQDPAALQPELSSGAVLIHLGWSKTPGSSESDPQQSIHANVDFSTRLFELAVAQGIKRIVLASSGGAIYGDAVPFPTPETAPTQPVSPYGVAKLMAECALRDCCQGSDTAGISLRISNPYGLHQIQHHTQIGLIAALIDAMRHDRPLTIWGDGSTVRDYIHIDDVAQAFQLAVEQPELSGVFNIGSGVGTATRELIALLERLMNQRCQIQWQAERRCDVHQVILDHQAFSQATGWQPRLALTAGINDLLNSMAAPS